MSPLSVCVFCMPIFINQLPTNVCVDKAFILRWEIFSHFIKEIFIFWSFRQIQVVVEVVVFVRFRRLMLAMTTIETKKKNIVVWIKFNSCFLIILSSIFYYISQLVTMWKENKKNFLRWMILMWVNSFFHYFTNSTKILSFESSKNIFIFLPGTFKL